jgi:hypothetical protein
MDGTYVYITRGTLTLYVVAWSTENIQTQLLIWHSIAYGVIGLLIGWMVHIHAGNKRHTYTLPVRIGL